MISWRAKTTHWKAVIIEAFITVTIILVTRVFCNYAANLHYTNVMNEKQWQLMKGRREVTQDTEMLELFNHSLLSLSSSSLVFSVIMLQTCTTRISSMRSNGSERQTRSNTHWTCVTMKSFITDTIILVTTVFCHYAGSWHFINEKQWQSMKHTRKATQDTELV